ncbi:MAG: hypothetical protein PVG44_16045 [Desulfobacterales bacterium]|jgi:predicted AAA+ superfamily ATPase
MMQAFLKGGYPEPVLGEDERYYDIWMENYIKTYVERDIRALFPKLDLIKYQRLVSMLSALSGTIINRSPIGRSLDISEKAIRDYLQIAEGSYIMIQQRQIQTLKNFVYENNLHLGIVINNSDDIQLVTDRILQLPATCT